ncbi:MAG: diacylglycerol kinase, partial [Actinomycetota bacterium]|nr:diacylglycerol kinase [Actinomycetota bacterium]
MNRRAAVVVNPTKLEDEELFRRHVSRLLDRYGWREPMWLPTTREDTGRGMTELAVAKGAELVLACGGDGTVMACVSGIANSGVPMAVLPVGTGNLLVRNLSLPTVVEDAVDVAVTGETRRIDVGRVSTDAGEWRFAVMAGVGFDAALVGDAPETLKARVGWPAYVVSAARH